MDAANRHWYLQQMGIPVWLPKGDVDLAAGSELPVVDANPAASQPLAKTAVEQQPTVAPASRDASSPAKALAASLRAKQTVDAVSENTDISLWLVMPFVDEANRSEADALVDKVLAAVEVDSRHCLKLWAVPDALPPAHIKHLWCFGIQPPPKVAAQALLLPSIADMLNNVDAKRAAWQQLKAAMPFSG